MSGTGEIVLDVGEEKGNCERRWEKLMARPGGRDTVTARYTDPAQLQTATRRDSLERGHRLPQRGKSPPYRVLEVSYNRYK